jgi:ATP-dependent protease HslVU (ClpYQ) peptidase subunit
MSERCPYRVPRDDEQPMPMTTVAAVARDGHVLMAGDSLTRVYDRPIRDGIRKVLRLPVGKAGEECLFGISGDGALADILSARLTLDAPGPNEDLQPWAAAVIWAITELAGDAGLTDAGQIDGSLLLGFRGRLWTLANNFAIPSTDGVAAIGSGEAVAVGALDVLLEQNCELGQAMTTALRIAVARDLHSDVPVYLELLRPTED